VVLSACRTTKDNGEACKGTLWGSDGYCWHHDPKNHDRVRRNALKGGRGKVNPGARAVRELMDHLTERVLWGDLEPSIMYAVVAAQNTKLKAIEIERKLEEADVRGEFEELKRELGIT
jgi:hypothetical protein